MAFGVGDSLKVRVSAATNDFTRGMENAQDSLNSVRNSATATAAALTGLGNRADEAEDNMASLDSEAEDTNRSFITLIASSDGLAVSMGVLGSSILPVTAALALLSTIAAPLIVTLGGLVAVIGSLAGSFGLLLGTGVATHWKEIQNALAEARKEIMAIIAPLGKVFGPLIVDAIERLPELVESIVKAIGGVEAFRRTLIQLGRFAARIIPKLVGLMFEIARKAIPFLRRALKNFSFSDLQSSIKLTARTMREMLPLLLDLAVAIAKALPPLVRFGTQVSKAVVPPLANLVGIIGDLLKWWNSLDSAFQKAIFVALLAPVAALGSGVIALVSAFAAAVVIVKNLDGVINTLWNSFVGLVSWLTSGAMSMIRSAFNILGSIIDESIDILGAVKRGFGDVAIWLATKGGRVIKETFSGLVDVVATVLSAGGGFLKEAIKRLSMWVSQAPEVLKDLANDVGDAIGSAVKQAIIGALKSINPANYVSLPNVGGGGRIISGPVIQGVQSGGLIESGGLAMLHEGERVVPASQVTDRGEVQVNGGASEVRVVVEGDTGVIKDVTAEMLNEQDRQVRRQSGTNVNPTSR